MSLNVCALFLPLRLLYHLLYYCSKECRSAEHREDEEKAEEKCLSSEAVGSVVMSNRDPPTYTEDEKDYLDIEALKRKLEETESAMTKIIARMSRIVPKTQVRLLICFSFDPPLLFTSIYSIVKAIAHLFYILAYYFCLLLPLV